MDKQFFKRIFYSIFIILLVLFIILSLKLEPNLFIALLLIFSPFIYQKIYE